MIVLAESNFVLELAFEQEEAEDARRIVALAEAKAIELVIPACALFEPYETLIRRRKAREALLGKLQDELGQLARSKLYENLNTTSRSVTEALAASGETQEKNLELVTRRILACAAVEPLTSEILGRALTVQTEFDLGPQDAIVLASVEARLKNAPPGVKLFVNRNSRDFITSDIEAHLKFFECSLLPKLSTARQFIESRLN